jgi:hypothetical protein
VIFERRQTGRFIIVGRPKVIYPHWHKIALGDESGSSLRSHDTAGCQRIKGLGLKTPIVAPANEFLT